MIDTQLRQIYTGVMEVFPDVIKVESSLTEAFARQKYFYPGNHSYNVYTYISDLYYESPVIISEKDMVIAIDVYLGKDYPLYMHLGLPLYKIRCMEPANLPIDVMKAIYFEDVMTPSRPRTLLDRMIGGGKLLAYLDAVLPEADDTLKICYSGSKLRWAEENERNVWAFLVQNELLYATDYQIQTKMIQDGPFTIFEQIFNNTNHFGSCKFICKHFLNCFFSFDWLIGHLMINGILVIKFRNLISISAVKYFYPVLYYFFRTHRILFI